ncbi:MAG: hypothetical protein JW927_03775 [Deltaproteobacteria bacterium]|nr:hypothetical protein [Deltaproteobacteria bacterium]
MKKIIMYLVLLMSVLIMNNAMAADNITGTWQGKLIPAPGSELIIQFKITQNTDGTYAVVLDSPDQGAIKNIQASSVVFSAGKLNLDVSELSGAYEGVLKNGAFEGNWKQEGTSIPLNLKPYEKPVLSKADLEKLAGSWYGPLKVPTGDQILAFRFEIKENGENKTFLDIPDSGSKDIPVSDVELANGTLILKISAIQADYKGKFTGDTIAGELKIQGQSFPLTLKKGEYKPQVALNLTKEIKDKLSGEWHGQLTTPRGLTHMAFRFEISAEDDFMGFLDILDQNIKGLPIKEASFADGKLSLKIKIANAEFKGTLANDMMTGEWMQAGLSNIPLSMKKGPYIPPAFTLNLSKETKDLLTGEWHGQRKMPKGFIHVSFRFETNDKGEFLGFYDVLDQGVAGIPITEAILKDGDFVLKMQKGINIEFKGQLAGDKLTGQVTQQGVIVTSFSMKKGKYVPPVYSLDIPKAIKDQLSGEWYGDIKTPTSNATVVFNFKTNDKGEFLGSEEIPEQKIKGILVSEASFTEGKLAFTVTDVEYKGQIKGDEFAGEIKQSAADSKPIPFTLKKGKYVPPDYSLNFPKDIVNTLSGRWDGKLGNTNVVFRFDKNEKGKLMGFLDFPDSKIKDLLISEGSMNEGKLALKIKIANIEYKGKLSKDSIEGEWLQGGQNIPLTMKKQ